MHKYNIILMHVYYKTIHGNIVYSTTSKVREEKETQETAIQ